MISYRFLEIQDVHLFDSLCQTLSSLQDTPRPTDKDIQEIIHTMHASDSRFLLALATHNGQETCVGTATILLEKKILRWGVVAGHIEDVSVHKDYQWQWIGSHLIQKALDYAYDMHAYKVILDCTEELASRYQKFSFEKAGVCMKIYNPHA